MRECCEKTLKFLADTIAEDFAEKRRFGTHKVPFEVPCLGCSKILCGNMNIDVQAVDESEQPDDINPSAEEIDNVLGGIEYATAMQEANGAY